MYHKRYVVRIPTKKKCRLISPVCIVNPIETFKEDIRRSSINFDTNHSNIRTVLDGFIDPVKPCRISRARVRVTLCL